MELILLASILSCADAAWILEGISKSETTNAIKSELRIEIIQSMPDNCSPEEYRSKLHIEEGEIPQSFIPEMGRK